MALATSLLFAFHNHNFADADWVQFNLKEIGLGTGATRFRFNLDDLNETPHINFSPQ